MDGGTVMPPKRRIPAQPRRITALDKHVGARIRIARLAARMSQTTLADACGISFQQVQKYENGHNRVGAGRLPVIAKVLGVEIPYFFDGSATPTASKKDRTASGPQEIIEGVLTSSLGMRLAKAFARLDDKKARHRVVELVEQMVEAQETVA
jgi:transcriptional regulator with XRE-family HTH domain